MGNWEDLQKKYQWMTRGENCRICDAMAGRVYTYDTWIAASILPGFHLHCNCYLKRVDDDTPESDKDIFGSDIDTLLDNKYFFSLKLNFNWQPYNSYLAGAVDKAMEETGLSAGEVMKSFEGYDLGGVFKSNPFKIWNQFSQWRVFRSLKESIDGSLTGTLNPTVKKPKAYTPSQTHKSNYRNWD